MIDVKPQPNAPSELKTGFPYILGIALKYLKTCGVINVISPSGPMFSWQKISKEATGKRFAQVRPYC